MSVGESAFPEIPYQSGGERIIDRTLYLTGGWPDTYMWGDVHLDVGGTKVGPTAAIKWRRTLYHQWLPFGGIRDPVRPVGWLEQGIVLQQT